MAPPRKSQEIDALAKELARLSTDEEKLAAIIKSQSDKKPLPISGVRAGGGNTSDPLGVREKMASADVAGFKKLIEQHGLTKAYMESTAKNVGEGILPLERAPCANVQVENRWSCPNEGKLACSRCKLVGYCSKVGDRFAFMLF